MDDNILDDKDSYYYLNTAETRIEIKKRMKGGMPEWKPKPTEAQRGTYRGVRASGPFFELDTHRCTVPRAVRAARNRPQLTQ